MATTESEIANLARLIQNPAETLETPQGALLAQVSNTVVGLYKRLYGKGPTKARSYFLDGAVVTVLRGGLTRAELTLIESGRADTVRRQRQEFQDAVRDEFMEAVSGVLGRKIVAFTSAMHHDPDLSVEVFVLEDGGRPENNGS
jgi:uncharacterized protein YbcI